MWSGPFGPWKSKNTFPLQGGLACFQVANDVRQRPEKLSKSQKHEPGVDGWVDG